MTNPTQDPKRPHVWWYPQPERLIINAAKCATPDPRDARLAELEAALQRIRTLAYDAHALVASVDPAVILSAIALIAVDALAGAQPEPGATVEVMTI